MSNISAAEEPSTGPLEIIELCEGKLHEIVSGIPVELFGLSDIELETHFKRTDRDFIIRKNLHKLAAEARLTGKKIMPTKLYDGVCTRQNFYYSILTNPHRVAWYLRPVEDYADLIEDAFYFGLKRARQELLTMPINEKTASAFLKALEFFASRHLGPLLQRIESKNLNATVDLNRPSQLSKEEINAQLKELEAAKSMAVIDVTPE
jgi:hypothetical protein